MLGAYGKFKIYYYVTMLFDLFFSPIADAIASTRRFTDPATIEIPPGSCGIPASKLWLALSQAPIAIVNDAIFAALSSIEYNPEPPAPTPTEPNDLPFPEMPTADDAPVEILANGGTWKRSTTNPNVGFGTKEYDSRSEASYYQQQSQIWCYEARVVKVSKGCYRLEAGDISRDRWAQMCRGNPNRLVRKEKPKRERLTEAMESRKRQLELEPIAELREKYRRALSAGFRPSFEVSTISRNLLVKALVEAAEWEFSRVA